MFKQKKTVFTLKMITYSMFLLHRALLFNTQTKQTPAQPDSEGISIFEKEHLKICI